MTQDESYIHRCLELAKLGRGYVAPNPLVGAVLVQDGTIIGEGYHQQFGKAHAEVNCIKSVEENNNKLLSQSTLYVSLEPCAHFGKTPPCTDMIIQHKIPRVVIGCRDAFEEVNGKGIEKLKQAGIEVTVGILENESKELNKRFFIFHQKHRPYIILKWAQTADKKMASFSKERLLITNEHSNRLVHQWRSEESAILIGTNTALLDNPSLNNRLAKGDDPVRMILDKHFRLPSTLKIFDNSQRTIIFNCIKQKESNNTTFYRIEDDENIIQKIMDACYQLNIQSVLVEGGAKLLQSFIDADIWDEVRTLTNESLFVKEGLSAPKLVNAIQVSEEKYNNDLIQYFKHE